MNFRIRMVSSIEISKISTFGDFFILGAEGILLNYDSRARKQESIKQKPPLITTNGDFIILPSLCNFLFSSIQNYNM